VTNKNLIRQPASINNGYNWIDIIQEYLLPPICILCGNPGIKGRDLCKNIKQAFSMTQAIPAQHIALLDDVMTTGSTAHELASLLKAAGVSRVDVWVVARA